MATCSGMELTGSLLPVNHHNVFPLIHKPGHQDGGGPAIHSHPEKQIERIAYWDNKSHKLIQQNHPDIVRILGDKDADGKPDEGFAGMFAFMDVIEIHAPHGILRRPKSLKDANSRTDRAFHWLQLLNLGYRVPGVINTDAHYNFHGSGWYRNFVHSSTDDPAQIDTMEMVKQSEAGHIIMSNGPFLRVQMQAEKGKEVAIPGDDIALKTGKVNISVQCPNWFDIDRVQILLNGKIIPEYNFTRKSHPTDFSSETVRFSKEIPLTFKEDTHLIVVAMGEESRMGPVVGPARQNDQPIAISNPI